MDIHQSRILICGASGLIGSALVRAARRQSADVLRLVRDHRSNNPGAIYWNYSNSLVAAHPLELENFNAVFHLSGANVAHRWTSRYREEIFRSRVESTRVLSERLAVLHNRPGVLLCASAVGIYGDRGDEELTEHSAPGSGFLADTCRAWESATKTAEEAGIRVVHLRFGIVLDRRGGALAKMLPPFRLGLGGRLGSGRQWMSWISLRDVVRAAIFLIEHEELAGAFNLTAPNPVTNKTFTQTLAHVLHRPAMFPVPRVALRAAFGAMADEGLLASTRALPSRLLQAGFAFVDEEIGPALDALLR